MKKEELFSAIGNISEQYIKEAHSSKAGKMDQKKNLPWIKWGAAAACLALVLGLGIPVIGRFTVHSPAREDSPQSDAISYVNKEALQSKEGESVPGPIEDLEESRGGIKDGSEEDKVFGEDPSGETSSGETSAGEDSASETSAGETPGSHIQDAPADENGEYREAVDSEDLTQGTAAFFGGSYLDESGRFVVVLTQDTPENRVAICKELGASESSTTFRTGTYTLAYLTQLQDQISQGMINRELPFVVSSGVYETSNRIRVSVTTEDETQLARLLALDTQGGAIEISYVSEGMTIKNELLEIRQEE